MLSFTNLVLIVCVAISLVNGNPKSDRVVKTQLSDGEPGSKHYDHDAFLGENQANEFEKLSPEESNRRLGIIFDKIDTNNDKVVSEQELKDWIVFTHQRYVGEDAIKEHGYHDVNGDGKVSWDEYYERNFGFLQESDWDANEDRGFTYKDLLAKDQKRWKAADTDGDGACTLEEYKAFLHPEEYDHMHQIVLDETLIDMDKDGDGSLDLTEYINDLYRPEEEDKDKDEPEWVNNERVLFKTVRDKDKDGKLNKEEVRDWILPTDYNHALSEAQHLIHSSDEDGDKHISKEEMLKYQDVFVGSQATEWGEILKRHDEF